jgi:hypothetical protein
MSKSPPLKRKPTAKKAAKRRVVAAGVIAGKKTKDIADALDTSTRNVQLIASERETQFLITAAFRPQQKLLTAMAARAVQVVLHGFEAMKYVKTGKDEYKCLGDAIARLRAVERYADLIALAQGQIKPEDESTTRDFPKYTWEELQVIYKQRRLTTDGEADNPDSAQSD